MSFVNFRDEFSDVSHFFLAFSKIGGLTIKDQVLGIATKEKEDAYLGPFGKIGS